LYAVLLVHNAIHLLSNVCDYTIKQYVSIISIILVMFVDLTKKKCLQLTLTVSQPPSQANPRPTKAVATALVHCREPQSLYVAPPLSKQVKPDLMTVRLLFVPRSPILIVVAR